MKPDAAEYWLDVARAKGLTVRERGIDLATLAPSPLPAEKPVPVAKRELLPSVFVPPGTFIVGVATYSITNSRDIRASIGRKGNQRRAVALLLGRHHEALMQFADDWLHKGRPLRITLIRLAPRSMDDDNLQGALKYIRDGVAEFMGVDDNSSRIDWEYGQQKSDRMGVRVELVKMD